MQSGIPNQCLYSDSLLQFVHDASLNITQNRLISSNQFEAVVRVYCKLSLLDGQKCVPATLLTQRQLSLF